MHIWQFSQIFCCGDFYDELLMADAYFVFHCICVSDANHDRRFRRFFFLENAVTLTLKMLGMLCFWSGMMQLAEKSGLTEKIARALSPLLRRLFPKSKTTKTRKAQFPWISPQTCSASAMPQRRLELKPWNGWKSTHQQATRQATRWCCSSY